MKYQRKQMIVDAIELQSEMTFNSKRGFPGDFLVNLEGQQIIFQRDLFLKHYEPFHDTPTAEKPVEEPEPEPESEKEGDIKEWEAPMTSNKICIACNRELPVGQIEVKSGICVDCLQENVKCYTCNSDCKRYELVGPFCRKCLKQDKKLL